MLEFKIFKGQKIVYALSEKSDGSMKLNAGSAQKQNDINRTRYLKKLGVGPENLVCPIANHTNHVAAVTKEDAGKFLEDTDGLVTAEKGLFISVTVADCLPIFLYDPKSRIIGMVHSGWRGTVKNIANKAIQKFKDLGSDPENILAAIGPGIDACHFAVQEDIAEQFSAKYQIKRDGKLYIDLKTLVRDQLISQGLNPGNIEVSTKCTFDAKEYSSFRRDKPEVVEAMMAVISMV